MIPALIILAALVVVGLVLFLLHKPDKPGEEYSADTAATAPEAPAPTPETPAGATAATSAGEAETVAEEPVKSDIEIDSDACCGMHITCEKDSLLASVSKEVEYFDDEELDRFAGRQPDAYEPEEIEEFRDVLLTLLPTDIAPWARSIQLRGINLPSEVRDELLMIVAEARKDAHIENF